jgi:hypothetical protein
VLHKNVGKSVEQCSVESETGGILKSRMLAKQVL